MAIFRKIHTSFWSDSFVSELERDKKLFYLYLMTNERTTQCGVYEITKKQIAFDLGYSIDSVSKLLKYFISEGKIRYNEQTNELALGNWLKYNNSTSPKVQSCMNKEFSSVKDTVLIQYVKSMDTRSQEEQEEEQEEYIPPKPVYIYNQFYDEQLKLSNNDPKYKMFIEILFGKNLLDRKLNTVLAMKEQVSFNQMKSVDKIKNDSGKLISELLVDMETWLMKNTKSKNTTVLGTLRTFAKR